MATHLTEQPRPMTPNHRHRSQGTLCVVNALGLQEHQITANKLYAFLAQ